MIVWDWESDACATWRIDRVLEAAHRVALGEGWALSSVGGAAEGVAALHTAQTSHDLGIWTYVMACPRRVLTGRVGHLMLEEKGRPPQHVYCGPFEATRLLSASAHAWERDARGAFTGGAVGFWGYGCRSALEGVEGDEGTDPDLWWGLYDTVLVHNRITLETRVVSHGWKGDGVCDVELAQARVEAWKSAWSDVSSGTFRDGTDEPLTLHSRVGSTAYAEKYRRVYNGISTGEMYQACLTYPMDTARPHTVHARGLFLKLSEDLPAPFASFLVPTSGPALASASPERFMSVESGRVTVRPMKGTRARSGVPEVDRREANALRESEKDRAENVMIVDLMRNDLGRVCRVGSVCVPALFTIESHREVHQMTSTVQGDLCSSHDALDAVQAAFPPGSMTGAPKIKAMEVLRSLEVEPRGMYAGVLGWLCGGDAELCVVIRSAIVSAERVVWHVGGGVVADSTLRGEWQEARSKCPAFWRPPQDTW